MTSRDRRFDDDELDALLTASLDSRVRADAPSTDVRQVVLQAAAQRELAAQSRRLAMASAWEEDRSARLREARVPAASDSPILILILHAQLLNLRGVQ